MPIAFAWCREVKTYEKITRSIVERVSEARLNGALPTIKNLPDIVARVGESYPGYLYEHHIKNILGVINSDRQLWLFMEWRTDPGLPNLAENLSSEINCLELVLASPSLVDGLVKKAIENEEEHLSWLKDIGPAVTAIKKRGRSSRGKDVARLAQYARRHRQADL